MSQPEFFRPSVDGDMSDFREAIRRAEAQAEAEQFPSGETPAEHPELEGAVPVSASDQPLPVEPVVETDTPTEQEPQVEEPVETLSVEELQAEVTRLQTQLSEKESFIGRQSTDVGELRRELEALREQVTATPQTAQTAQPQVVITQQMIDENPGYAAQVAFEQNNGQALAVAYEAWKEEDEVAALQWRTDKLLERQQAAFDARVAELEGRIAQVAAPQAQAAEEAQWSAAFTEMVKTHPDFLAADESGKTNAQRLLEEVAPQFPAIAELIANGDVQAKVQGLKLLYREATFGGDRVAAELQSAAEQAAAEAAAARAAAASVNGQTSAGQGSSVELTEEEAEVERYKARYSGGVSLSRGWTGRS